MSDIKHYEPLWGSWYVDELLGEGSYGKVYKVHREEFGKIYEAAVKILSIPHNEAELKAIQAESCDLVQTRSYFQTCVADIVQEIALMSSFRGNSNIVSLEDHRVIEHENDIGWDILIRMELLKTLSDYVNEKPLTTDEIIKLGVDICSALEICAMRNTIHRDIKPDNIFVSQYGDFKLGDFGIARQIERTISAMSKKGSNNYMAPEVFKGEAYGATVDLYSLGIVMYRFLNKNRSPFMPFFPAVWTSHDKEEAIIKRMRGDTIPDIPDIDSRLNAIVLKACAYNYKERFNNATEMKNALLDFIGGEQSIILQRKLIPESNIEDIEDIDDIDDYEDEDKDEDFNSYDDKDDENEGTFRMPMQNSSMSEIIEDNAKKPGFFEDTTNIYSIIAAICFGALALLIPFSGRTSDILIYAPVYALCFVEAIIKFRNKILNYALIALLVLEILFMIQQDFYIFDYTLLVLALSLISLEITSIGKNKYCAVFAVFCSLSAVLTGLYILQLQYVNASTAAAVPVIFLLASPAPFVLIKKPKACYAVLISLQAIIILIALAYYANRSSIFYYMADANFTGFSADRFQWWLNGRFLGLLLQVAAQVSLLKVKIMSLS